MIHTNKRKIKIYIKNKVKSVFVFFSVLFLNRSVYLCVEGVFYSQKEKRIIGSKEERERERRRKKIIKIIDILNCLYRVSFFLTSFFLLLLYLHNMGTLYVYSN